MGVVGVILGAVLGSGFDGCGIGLYRCSNQDIGKLEMKLTPFDSPSPHEVRQIFSARNGYFFRSKKLI